MNRDGTEFTLTVAYERVESGWLMATIPSMPGVISTGPTREEARTNVLDALRLFLDTPAGGTRSADTDVLRVRLELEQRRDLGRGI